MRKSNYVTSNDGKSVTNVKTGEVKTLSNGKVTGTSSGSGSSAANTSSGGSINSTNGTSGSGNTSSGYNTVMNTISQMNKVSGGNSSSGGSSSGSSSSSSVGGNNTSKSNIVSQTNNTATATPTKTGSVSTNTSNGSLSVVPLLGNRQSNGVTVTGNVLAVQSNGKAPSTAKVGDQVVTAGGTYLITGGSNGNYTSVKVSSANTNNYKVAGSGSGGSNTVAQSQSSAPVNGSYSINSAAGRLAADGMAVGDSFNASDGSVWTKNADGTITVTKDGRVLSQNAYSSMVYGNGTQGNAPIAGSYAINSQLGQKISDGLAVGGTFNASDGSVWTKNADGSISVSKDGAVIAQNAYNAKIYGNGGTNEAVEVTPDSIASLISNGQYTSMATDNATGSEVYFVTDANGIVHCATADGSDLTPGSKLTYKNDSGALIQSTLYRDMNGSYFKGDNNASNLVEIWSRNSDGEYVYNEAKTEEGYYYYDGYTYNSQTGQSVRSADEPVMGDDDLVFYNGTYYTRTGEVFEGVQPLTNVVDIDDKALNDFINEFLKQYYETTDFENYGYMTREEAQAKAAEQLNPSYDEQLQKSLDKMNVSALNTGFFGQLPTEELKAQAAASAEVERQNAINELASQLYDQSYNTAYQNFTADQSRQGTALNTLMDAVNLYNSYQSDQTDQKQAAANQLYNALETLYSAAAATEDVSKMSDAYSQLQSFVNGLQGK